MSEKTRRGLRPWVRNALIVVPLVALAVVGLMPRVVTDPLRTLASIRQIDDYPLYVMTYYGDYGFDEFLQVGIPWDGSPDPDGSAHQESCTTFAALNEAGDVIVGRNFDWMHHAAMLLFTDPPEGYASAAMVDMAYMGYDEAGPGLAGRSGLLGAPYIPFDGMNERGLAVSIMAVPTADVAYDPGRPTLDSLHIVRLLLDYAQDVDEAVALIGDYNIDFGGGPELHYMVADASGRSAVIEFVDGEIVVLENAQPWQAATNFTIATTDEASRPRLCARYAAVTETLSETDGLLTEEEAMSLLGRVSASGSDTPTMWSVVYNLTTGDIRIVVGREYETVHDFSLRMVGE
jgi:hypothetical protein